jgi:hypothetical protein
LFCVISGRSSPCSIWTCSGSGPSADAHTLTGDQYFRQLISGPFHQGLSIVFGVAITVTLVAAVASMLRGRQYIRQDEVHDQGIEDMENAVVPVGGSATKTG